MACPDIVRDRLVTMRGGGYWRDVADQIGISPALLSAVLNGDKPPSPRFLAALGLEKVTVYREKGGE